MQGDHVFLSVQSNSTNASHRATVFLRNERNNQTTGVNLLDVTLCDRRATWAFGRTDDTEAIPARINGTVEFQNALTLNDGHTYIGPVGASLTGNLTTITCEQEGPSITCSNV